MDFTNPEFFYHDVNSVAGLLKQFFRDLPDPLFTSQFYPDFINAAREYWPLKVTFRCIPCRSKVLTLFLGIDDDIQRRDSLHALVNNLPDAHYATLRAVVLVRHPTTIYLLVWEYGRLTLFFSFFISISTRSKSITQRTVWMLETLPSVLGKSESLQPERSYVWY